MRLGLIGNGAIAGKLAAFCATSSGFEVAGALVRSRKTQPAGNYPLVDTLQELMALAPELVVECAGHEAVKQFGAPVLQSGTDLVVASVGVLHDDGVRDALHRAARAGGSRVIFPPGALAGLESLATAAVGGLDTVTLRSSKPPQAWRGTHAEQVHDLGRIESPTVIFDGTAREAARLFPKNANVAASVAIFGIGFDRTRVILVADPLATANTHLLEARGVFGRMKAEIEAAPSPANPKTSLMTALSIIRCVELEAVGRKGRGELPLATATASSAGRAVVAAPHVRI